MENIQRCHRHVKIIENMCNYYINLKSSIIVSTNTLEKILDQNSLFLKKVNYLIEHQKNLEEQSKIYNGKKFYRGMKYFATMQETSKYFENYVVLQNSRNLKT